jgi:hypothetical protein
MAPCLLGVVMKQRILSDLINKRVAVGLDIAAFVN